MLYIALEDQTVGVHFPAEVPIDVPATIHEIQGKLLQYLSTYRKMSVEGSLLVQLLQRHVQTG